MSFPALGERRVRVHTRATGTEGAGERRVRVRTRATGTEDAGDVRVRGSAGAGKLRVKNPRVRVLYGIFFSFLEATARFLGSFENRWLVFRH